MKNAKRLLELAGRDFPHDTAKPNLQVMGEDLTLLFPYENQWLAVTIPQEALGVDPDDLWAEVMSNF